ncbi:VWA domain-containing protein [Brevibacterium sp. FME37]|uniref:VWA domain-containing protein n=1 Tax=Brevibacterium sp. FME37 TaxID=2742607 RepID=UPI0018661ACC|nr:VWA domain-containing protein [Brevibacterium sp. FME37]
MTSLTDMLIRLGAGLRAAGLPADPEAVRSLIRAAAMLDPLDPHQIRAASRALTCTQRGHLPIHDAVFDSTFGLSQARRSEDPGIEVVIPRPEVSIDSAGGAEMSEITEASRAEHLRHVDLGLEDGGEAVALIDGLVFRPPRGAAHRSRPGHTGVVDTRRVLRQLIRSEEISSIPRRRNLYRRRPVTLVADVSASMTAWRESVLRFLGRGAEALGARCFTAGTRLTRVDGAITASGLRSGRDGATAVLGEVLDAGGGTRLGDSLFELLTGRTKDLVRGSVLVVISDGWEHGDCAELERACARLARLSHRFLWVNPRAGRPGFQPRTRGLAVAAGHAEAVLPATTVAQWQTVARTIAVRATAHGRVTTPASALTVPTARAGQEVWA